MTDPRIFLAPSDEDEAPGERILPIQKVAALSVIARHTEGTNRLFDDVIIDGSTVVALAVTVDQIKAMPNRDWETLRRGGVWWWEKYNTFVMDAMYWEALCLDFCFLN